MPTNLFESQLFLIIAAVVGGVFLLISIVYGVVRKFSRMTWIGWEMILVFGIVVGFSYIPVPEDGFVAFFVEFLGLAAAVGLVLALDMLLRRHLFSRPLKSGKGVGALDRIFGILTAFVTLAVFAFVLGGVALVFADAFMGEPVLNFPIWTDFFAKYAVDLFLAAMLYLVIRAGYRLGLLKAILYLLALALTVLAFVLAVYSCAGWGFLASLADKFASLFGFPADFNAFLGFTIMTLIVFVVYFIVAMVIVALLDRVIRIAITPAAVGIIDGVLAAVLALAIFMGIYVAIGLGVHYLAGDALAELLSGLPEEVASFADGVTSALGEIVPKIEGVFTSSPVSAVLYRQNFVWLLLH